nr:MAG TPA: minor tail protein [Caudoviricetes sp.]
MASTIKGITVEIDGNVQPLNKRLKEVTDTARKLDSELRVIDRLLKLDPSNTTLLAQKQKLLADSIANTKTKLKELTTAQEQAKAQLERGEIGADQYRALEREVIRAQNSLKYFESQAKQVDEALEQTENESKQAGEAFDEMGDAAQKSEKDMKSLSVGGVALGTVLGNVATKLLELAGNAATFLTDAVEETKEFRSDLSKLEQNAKAAGTGIDDVTDDLEYFVAITDETDSSVEALSNLLKAGFTGETLTDAVNNLSGAVVAFPDTLKIESLADSLQETLATGEATGQYGELLERLGVNLEDFNKGLQKCTTSAEKQQYAVDILAKNGMADLNAQYKEANTDLIAYSTAQTRYTETLSKVGAAMQPVMTAFTDIKTLLLEGMIPALETTGQALSEKLASPKVQDSIKKIGEFLGDAAKAFADFAMFVIENGEVIIKVIGSIAAGFATWKIAGIIGSIVTSIKKFDSTFKKAGGNIINTIKKINTASLSTVIGAIAAAVTAIISFAFALRDSNEAVNKIADDSSALIESSKETAEAFSDTQAEIAVTSELAKEYAGEVLALNDKVKQMEALDQDATKEKRMLADATVRLNEITGQTTATIDENTGMLNENKDAIYDSIDAMETAAKESAYLEYWQNLIKQATEYEIQSRNNLKVIKEDVTFWDTLTGSARKALDAYYDTEEAMKTNASEMETFNEFLAEQGLTISDLTSKREEDTDSINENTEAVSELTEQEAIYFMQRLANNEELSQSDQEALDLWKSNNAERAEDLEQAIQHEAELYQQRVDAASQADRLIAENQNESLTKQASIIEQNTELTKQFIEDQEFLRQQLPGMSKYIDQLTEADAVSLRRNIEDWDNGGKEKIERFFAAQEAALNINAPGFEQDLYETEKEAMAKGAQGITDSEEITNAATEEMNSTVDAMRAIVTDDGNFYYLGIGIINRLASGMREMAWKLYDVADSIVNTLKNKFSFEISVSSTGRGAKFQGFATGGIISREQIVRVAERGPEAIIPLDRLGGIIQGVLDNNGGGNGGNTYQLNVYTSDLSDGAQVRLFKNFSKWAGRRLD